LKENVTVPQPKMKKVTDFGSNLKSSLIQYLEKENREAGKSIPDDTVDIQLSSQNGKKK
jgi:hypothetical protein